MRFTSNSQRDGDFYTYELIDNLEDLPELARTRGVTEIHIVRATGRSAAEIVFNAEVQRRAGVDRH